jgi:hypothetical protein
MWTRRYAQFVQSIELVLMVVLKERGEAVLERLRGVAQPLGPLP